MLDKIANMATLYLSKKPAESCNKAIVKTVCAQECIELSKALTDDFRLYLNDHTLRKRKEIVSDNINEEVADVLITINNLRDAGVINDEAVLRWAKIKLQRYESLNNCNEKAFSNGEEVNDT